MNILTRIFALLLLTSFVACKESYTPEVTTVNLNYLVVEGFINTGADSTIVNLSRTVIVSNKNVIKPELGATILIESDANSTYPLKDLGNGIYAVAGLNLDQTKKYRLRIKTQKGLIYLSDFVESKVSPAIDEVNFTTEPNGVQIYVNAHDNANISRYYRWEFQETWEFHAKEYSMLKWDGKNIVDRKLPDEQITVCYTSDKAHNIILGSTAKLDKDVVSKAPVNFIERGSEKLSVRYSTLVKQYVLTKQAFDFWEKLRKNTESLGSIFDAQPSQLVGNIHNVADLNEPVIGYIGAGTTTQKRIFIDIKQLPNWKTIPTYDCGSPDTLQMKPGDMDPVKTGEKILLGWVTINDIPFPLASSRPCADCTIRGSVKKPSFW